MQERRPIKLGPILCALLVVACVLMVVVYQREGATGPIHSVQAAIAGIVAPLQGPGEAVSSAVDDLGQAQSDGSADAETLSALKEQNAQLRNLLAQAEEYRLKAQDLENLLNLKDVYDIDGMGAHVIGRSTDSWNQTITLDIGETSGRLKAQDLENLLNLKDVYDIDGMGAHVIGRSTDSWNQTITLDIGETSGVKPGLTVMGAYGVIGQVASVSDKSCTVRLLTDPQSGVAALIQSNRAEGIVRGSLDGLLYLENVAADVSVEPGDVVLTSGLGGSYQRGLLIGSVVKVEGRAGDATRTIVVSPNDITHGYEDVIVVFEASGDTGNSGSSDEGSNKDEGASS